jgi:hypothetical protein
MIPTWKADTVESRLLDDIQCPFLYRSIVPRTFRWNSVESITKIPAGVESGNKVLGSDGCERFRALLRVHGRYKSSEGCCE